MADTSSQCQKWCQLISTLEATLQEWIESSLLPFITLTDCSEVKKACVVPLSSGSRTGSSHWLFNLTIKLEIAPEEVGRQPNATNGWENKPRTWAWSKMKKSALNNIVFWDPLWRILGRGLPFFSSHLNKTGGLNNLKLITGLNVSSFSLFWPKGCAW